MKTFPIKKIDLKKVDIHNDFRDFPQIFSTVQDIEDFIKWKKLKLPVLKEFLRLYKTKKELSLTPTEFQHYFNNLFDYVYDVYRIPVEETYKETVKWLGYIEAKLVIGGLNEIIRDYYQRVFDRYESSKITNQFLIKLGKRRQPEIINYYTDIGESNDYYNSKKENLIESFWIKSSRHAGQPVLISGEAYMRVHVYPEKVYIFGCDDSSYTYSADSEEDSKQFALMLKTASPVWHFGYKERFGKKFQFTN